MTKRSNTIIPPDGGWKPQTYYHVEISSGPSNPIHGGIFYSGFLDERGNPAGYNELLHPWDEHPSCQELYYIKALSPILTAKDMHEVPNRHHFCIKDGMIRRDTYGEG